MLIGMDIRRSSVSVLRSRSIVMDVTTNITRNGNSPSSLGASRSNATAELKTYLSRTMSTTGTTSMSASVRGSCRSWTRIRRAVAHVMDGLMIWPASAPQAAGKRLLGLGSPFGFGAPRACRLQSGARLA